LGHLDNKAKRASANIDEAVKVQQDALHAQLKQGIQFLKELRIRSRVDKILGFFHMIVNFLKLIDSDQGASMDDIAHVLMGFIKQGTTGDAHAADAPLQKLKKSMEAKMAKAKMESKKQVVQDNKEIDKNNAKFNKKMGDTVHDAEHQAENTVNHPLVKFLEEAAGLELIEEESEANPLDTVTKLNAKNLGKAAGAATTSSINDAVHMAKKEINTSTGGAQAKILKMITNPKNLNKIVKFLEKTFDKMLHELEAILKGDFITGLMELMHIQLELHVYATDAKAIFLASEVEIDAAFFVIFASIFFATIYALILSSTAVGYLYGYCRCCASLCSDPDGYIKEDKYEAEGPCLNSFRCRSLGDIINAACCCRCCKEKPDHKNKCVRGTCKACSKCGNGCRWWFCDLKNAFTCASIWINCNFILLLIPLTIAVGLIIAAFILWYGSCYGINIMTEAICKMLNTYAHQLQIDPSKIAVCNGQGPCDAVSKTMPIAAFLVGGGTMVLFFCQYQILGAMWKNYYWSRHHHENLSKLVKEDGDRSLMHKKKWLAAHPGASEEEVGLLKQDKDKYQMYADTDVTKEYTQE